MNQVFLKKTVTMLRTMNLPDRWWAIGLLSLVAIGMSPHPTLSLALNCTETSGAAAAQVDLGKCTVRLIDGTEIEAAIASIGRDGSLTGAGVPASLNLSDVVTVVSQRKLQRNDSHPVSIHAVGGGIVLGADPGVTGEEVRFQSSTGINKIALQATRAIVWSNSPMVESAIGQPSSKNDIVIVATDSGERRVEGILESIDREFVGINYKNQSRKIGIEKVKAVVTANLGIAQPDGPRATVRLTEESTLAGSILELSDGRLAIEVAKGTVVEVGASMVVDISIVSDRVQFLSDQDPVEVQEDAVFAIQLPWQRDRSVGNRPLSIRKSDSDLVLTYKKGLGTQASSRLVFANPSEFDRFVATVGIDSETNGRGDCQMVVRGDGIELWSGRVKGAGGPQEIDVDITGIKQVALLVYPGEGFDLGDHANWCNARFLKTR